MGWSNDEPKPTKQGMNLTSKLLISIIVFIVLIIVMILILLINVEKLVFIISINGKEVTSVTKQQLLTKVDNTTYVDIEQFADLVGYEYHEGEYKAFTIEENKCYVQGKLETATFFLNDNKVCKLPLNDLTSEYNEFIVENTIKEMNHRMYAPAEAISLAFNVVIEEEQNSFEIYTLDFLVDYYDDQIKKWGYTGITGQSFENQKSLLYGYFIVRKPNGLYKIINEDNSKEIVLDKYKKIEFNESTKEFFVTNSLGQVGIINLDGTTKIEPTYESISILDKKSDLYLIKKDDKYGVVKSGNIRVIYPEYDRVGLDPRENGTNERYLILETLIPVCKNQKWGAFNKEGKLVLEIKYDGFGCDIYDVKINDIKKQVEPVVALEKCNGIVVQKDGKYGMLDITGKELVPIQVESIYKVLDTKISDDTNYFMLYNGKELNVIERLIAAGLMEDPAKKDNEEDEITNTTNNTINNTTNNIITNDITNNTLVNSIPISAEISNNVENGLVSGDVSNVISNNIIE